MADRYLDELAAPPITNDGFTLEEGGGVLILETLVAEPASALRYYLTFVSRVGGVPGV